MTEFVDRVEFYEVVALKDSGKALLCRLDGEHDDLEVWFPHSQIDDDSEVYKEGTSGTLVVSRWIAVEKGLV